MRSEEYGVRNDGADKEITSAQVIFPDKITLDEFRAKLEARFEELGSKIAQMESSEETTETTE